MLICSVLALTACDALTIATTTRPSDNVAVSMGTTITKEGVSKPTGQVKVGLF